MPKLAQILKRSNDSRQVCVSVFFFSDHCIKQIDSMLPWVCSVIDHRWRQNVVKTKKWHTSRRLLFVKLITIITTITILIKNVNENVNINAINVDVDVNVKVK